VKKPILFSFFSGAGFMDLGFEKENFPIAFVNEIHKPFLEAYKYSRKNMRMDETIYGYDTSNIEDFMQ